MSSLYRADHVGSFLRPRELLEARRAQVTSEELEALEDRHISRVFQKQQELGLGVFTDGELRRSNFMSDFTDAVDGFDLGDAVARSWSDKAQRSPASCGRCEQNQRDRDFVAQTAPALNRARAAISPRACAGAIKITLPSPTQFPAISFKYGVTDAVYRDPYALLDAITGIMVEDISALAGSGISYLQIDAPRYSYYLDPKWSAWMETSCVWTRQRC